MKYLKPFNESIDNVYNILQNIEDILQDLKDDEFKIDAFGNKKDNSIIIRISKDFSNYSKDYTHINFLYEKSKDYIYRLIDYMNNEQYHNFGIYNGQFDSGFVDMKEYENLIKSGSLNKKTSIIIKFTK